MKFAYDKNEDDELNLRVGDVVINVVEVSSKDVLQAQGIGLLLAEFPIVRRTKGGAEGP